MAGVQAIQVQVPPGAQQGQVVQVVDPNTNQPFQVQVPAGVQPGMVFTCALPSSTPVQQMTAPPPPSSSTGGQMPPPPSGGHMPPPPQVVTQQPTSGGHMPPPPQVVTQPSVGKLSHPIPHSTPCIQHMVRCAHERSRSARSGTCEISSPRTTSSPNVGHVGPVGSSTQQRIEQTGFRSTRPLRS